MFTCLVQQPSPSLQWIPSRPLQLFTTECQFATLGHMWPFRKGKQSRLIDRDSFERNLASQTAMAPQTVAQLQNAGMRPKANLRLEYFFYAASSSNGEDLARDLKAKGYSAECRRSADGSSLYCITGWTVPFPIDETSTVEWTEEMCRLGYHHDCEFDGWGTNPIQPELQN